MSGREAMEAADREILRRLKRVRADLKVLINDYGLSDLTDWLVTLETETIPEYQTESRASGTGAV